MIDKCDICEYFCSDCATDCVCDHPKFRKEYPEGRTIDLDLIIPDWCPK